MCGLVRGGEEKKRTHQLGMLGEMVVESKLDINMTYPLPSQIRFKLGVHRGSRSQTVTRLIMNYALLAPQDCDLTGTSLSLFLISPSSPMV